MNYLTKDELLDLHIYAVSPYGGRMGIASQDRLTTVLEAPRQIMFGTELYPDTILFSAGDLTISRSLIADNASEHGTFVNDQRVLEPTLLRSGDLIRVGNAYVRFRERTRRDK